MAFLIFFIVYFLCEYLKRWKKNKPKQISAHGLFIPDCYQIYSMSNNRKRKYSLYFLYLFLSQPSFFSHIIKIGTISTTFVLGMAISGHRLLTFRTAICFSCSFSVDRCFDGILYSQRLSFAPVGGSRSWS